MAEGSGGEDGLWSVPVSGRMAGVLAPLLSLLVALALSGLVVVAAGEDPWAAVDVLIRGAFGTADAIGYTLMYATDFIFTGLAVAVAFQCGLFNIGAEGQAMLGGLGVALVGLALPGWPWPVVAAGGTVAAALLGAAWACVPAWAQARRGSHIVITTIMFNFIAASLMTWLLVDVLIKPGQQSPESAELDPAGWLPALDQVAGWFGGALPASPLNLSFVLALGCCGLYGLLMWRTRWGYAIRAVGASERAAVYAGIVPARVVILAMLVSGALAGLAGVNQVLGVHHRLLLNMTGGAGFVGIAVALMGRGRPLGIVLAAVLFGALQQGGSELAFEFQGINRDLVVVIQGLAVLLGGALEGLFRRPLARWLAMFRRPGGVAA
jgi:simple sugar transport system permease protein